MPSLICDPRPNAAELVGEYAALREAGESLLLFWPSAAPLDSMALVNSSSELDAALEDEQLACLSGSLPPWLALDDFQRILLLESSPTADAAWLAHLFAHGADEVELLHPAAIADLSQSWHSGRRTGGTLHRRR